MGIRDALRRQPAIAGGVAGLMLVFSAVFVLWSLREPSLAVPTGEVWASSDGGQSYFAVPLEKLPPFIHQGREAVWAQVVTDGSTRRVSYLTKVTPEAKQQLENLPISQAVDRLLMSPGMRLVKRPGDSEWVSAAEPAGQRIVAEQSVRERTVVPGE